MFDVNWQSYTVFQLGIFPRAVAPARTALRPARIGENKKKYFYFCILQNVIAVFVLSDSRCKNACKMFADLCLFSSIVYKIVPCSFRSRVGL